MLQDLILLDLTFFFYSLAQLGSENNISTIFRGIYDRRIQRFSKSK